MSFNVLLFGGLLKSVFCKPFGRQVGETTADAVGVVAFLLFWLSSKVSLAGVPIKSSSPWKLSLYALRVADDRTFILGVFGVILGTVRGTFFTVEILNSSFT